MKSLVALLLLPAVALGQFCGPDEIPDKIAVNQDGEVALGCTLNECHRDVNNPSIKAGPPKCSNRYYELSCPGPLQWVGGIPRGSNINNVVPLQCCSAQSLKDSPQANKAQKIVERNQVFEGQVYTDKLGNVIGYDIIKNVQKVNLGNNNYGLSVTVSRLSCEPKRAAQIGLDSAQLNVGQPQEIIEGAFQGPLQPIPVDGLDSAAFQGLDAGLGPFDGADAAAFQGLGQAGLGQAGLGQAGLGQGGFGPGLGQGGFGGLGPGLGGLGGLGFGAGAGACFTGETQVETPAGPMAMKDLKIGDQVLTVNHGKIMGWAKVESFLHRLPEKEADFHKITGSDGSSITLTPLHFIYTTPCNTMKPTMKYAKDVVPGSECLIKVNADSASKAPIKILSNEVTKVTGVYNPMTDNGVIVADGYMASCHNIVADNSFMNSLTETVQYLQKLFSWESSEQKVELPWALQFCVDYASKLL